MVRHPLLEDADGQDAQHEHAYQVWVLRPDRLVAELEDTLDGPEDVAELGVLDQKCDGEEGEEVVAGRPNLIRHEQGLLCLRLVHSQRVLQQVESDHAR